MITMFKIGDELYENEREINRFDPMLQSSWSTLDQKKASQHDNLDNTKQRKRKERSYYDEVSSSDSNAVSSEAEN